jgi:hypothetical protein
MGRRWCLTAQCAVTRVYRKAGSSAQGEQNCWHWRKKADQADLPTGVDLPEELIGKIAWLAAAKATIAARAKERYQREKAEYDEKVAPRRQGRGDRQEAGRQATQAPRAWRKGQ